MTSSASSVKLGRHESRFVLLSDSSDEDEIQEDDVKPEVYENAKMTKPNRLGKRKSTSQDAEEPTKRPRRTRTVGTGGRRWTGPELEALFNKAIEATPNFDGAVPGRTANQCSQTWRATVIPYIKKCLQERGGQGR